MLEKIKNCKYLDCAVSVAGATASLMGALANFKQGKKAAGWLDLGASAAFCVLAVLDKIRADRDADEDEADDEGDIWASQM
ncbi:hypothetical protein [Bifidobacterium choloepi]|uniref:Uncharacterized protein n=1 Tax=Bifidobacterium choloepi TaxID=2614131 RepID=A0A6I5MY79_9BIFI|nr:hypothetical protein [Bifidobacterium choloepi]NEG69227.1 hypothetical protein [Bifidobacterium choloepi]